MRRHVKKTMSIFLSLAIIVSMLPAWTLTAHAAVIDQSFDALPAQESLKTDNPSLSPGDGFTYSTDSKNDALRIDTIANTTGNLTSMGSGNALSNDWYGTNTDTYFQFKSINPSDDFKLESFEAEVFTHNHGMSEIYTITGYNDGVQVAAATVDFVASGTYGLDDSTISYSRQTISSEEGISNAGKLTFTGRNWSNIDQLRMTVADSFPDAILWVVIDNIDVSPNTVPSFIGTTALTVSQNAAATDVKGHLHVNDADSGQTLTWTVYSVPSHGTLAVSGTTASSGGTDITPGGTITYTPTAGYAGSDSFAVQVSDGVATATRTITVTVKSADAGLTSVAGQTDLSPGGGGATPGAPITWNINVSNPKSTLALADIIAASGATKNLYANADYATGEVTGANTIVFTEGGTTTVYIKVTSEDTLTTKYYAVAVSRLATLPAVTTGTASGVTHSSANIGGTVTDSHGSVVTEVGVVYSTISGTDPVIGGTGVTKVRGTLTSSTIAAALTDLAPGTTYYFRAYATNGVGTSYGSKYSFTTTATFPGAPVIGTATAGDTSATVSFTVPAFNGGAEITSYTVTANPGGATGTGAGSPITVTGLKNGTAYAFTVTATNSAGTGAASASSNSVTPKASQTIFFNNPGTQNFGTTPTLTASATSGLEVTLTSDTPDVCSITSGGELTFRRVGTAKISASQAGSDTYLPALTVTQTFAVNAVVPGAPTIGTATGGSGQAAVTFSAPMFDGGSAITGYTVTSNPGGVTATGSASPITVTGLTNGVAYTFTVTATNSAGTSVSLASSNSVTPNPGPAVVSVGVPATGYYKEGQILDFTVNFDQNTVVTGTPRIALVIGSTTVYAQYVLSVSPSVLVFRYTVEADRLDTDGIAVGDLTLNGGTIQNMVGLDAGLTLNTVGSTSKVCVDAVTPDAPSTLDMTAASDTGISSTDNITMINTPTFTGRAESCSTVILYVKNTDIGTTTADGFGNWIFTVPPGSALADGTYSITAKAMDTAGNTSPSSGGLAITIDTASPSVTISSALGSPTGTSPIPATIIFSENVTGFTIGDIAVVNGTAADFSGSGATYTVNIIPAGDGEVAVDVVAAVAQDAAGNGSTAAARLSLTYDVTAPTVGGSGAITTSELTSSSVKLTCAKASDTVTAAASLQYKVVYSTSNNISTVGDVLANGSVAKDWTADLSDYTVAGLSASTDYSFNVLVRDAAGNVSAYTAVTARTTAVSSGSSGDNNGATVIVNGQSQTAGTFTTGTNASGQTVTTVTVNTGKLENILASQGSGATVTIPVTGSSDVVAGTLTGTMIKNMENKDATLVLQTNSGSYTLPASEINIEAMSQQFGASVSLADINVTVSISEPSTTMKKVVENAAQDSGFTNMVPAVDYTIICTYGSQTVNVSSFNAYVERTIAIPDGVDPAKITTGVVVDPDGTVHHVPTRITLIDGKYYAVINSLTNSTYSVIWNPVEFTDVFDHWAKDAVNNMGSRMIVTGVGNNNYAPDRNMRRAEFATIIVRALGLEPGTGASGFADVASSQWYSGYIKTAAAYGIVTGYENGSFGPNDTITREQAMTILMRAMKITGLNAGLTGDESGKLLSVFSDSSAVSAYARDSIAACLKTGIISGTSAITLSPKDAITRAEVAVMVERLLQKSELI